MIKKVCRQAVVSEEKGESGDFSKGYVDLNLHGVKVTQMQSVCKSTNGSVYDRKDTCQVYNILLFNKMRTNYYLQPSPDS
jgi:hypothetical protein